MSSTKPDNSGDRGSRWHLDQRFHMADLLKSDLYTLRGHGEWVSPLNWRVHFADLPDPTVTITDPFGKVYREFPKGLTVQQLNVVLP